MARGARGGEAAGSCGYGATKTAFSARGVTDARVESGDVIVEGSHAVGVAGHDDDEVLLVVLHDVEKDLDALLPVVAVVGGVVKIVGLRARCKGQLAHCLVDAEGGCTGMRAQTSV